MGCCADAGEPIRPALKHDNGAPAIEKKADSPKIGIKRQEAEPVPVEKVEEAKPLVGLMSTALGSKVKLQMKATENKFHEELKKNTQDEAGESGATDV